MGIVMAEKKRKAPASAGIDISASPRVGGKAPASGRAPVTVAAPGSKAKAAKPEGGGRAASQKRKAARAKKGPTPRESILNMGAAAGGFIAGQLDEIEAGRGKDANLNWLKKYVTPDSAHRSNTYLVTPGTQPGLNGDGSTAPGKPNHIPVNSPPLPQPSVVSVGVPAGEKGPKSFQPPPPLEIKASNAPPAAHVARAGNANPVSSAAPASAPRLAAAPTVTGLADSPYDATRFGAGEVRGNQFFDRLHRSVDKAVFGGTAKSQNATYKYPDGDNRSDKD